ncbi:prefoldin subunit alpha [Candidatus Nitrosotalea bavarica]|jgi:prefoldin alpha subunit|uniref:prefoldin subunit alpha n=1 Tax=Candidatus Nitrosotalea bavarica TaxID=1903277 RepID=UPI000C70B5E4|nr:prefoldin subunit alpha [Candidatus Nitrosotalea bavarica]
MSEEHAQALLQQMQSLESYLNDLLQREETVMRLLQEATNAVESMKVLTGNSEYETLVPVGLGVYVKAKINPDQKMIVNIGAGASVEQNKESAINYMESRIKELEMVLQQLASQRQEVSMKLEQGQHEMNKLIQSNRSSPQ